MKFKKNFSIINFLNFYLGQIYKMSLACARSFYFDLLEHQKSYQNVLFEFKEKYRSRGFLHDLLSTNPQHDLEYFFLEKK
jgi:hypothetical protein